jgi:hypothetical protein
MVHLTCATALVSVGLHCFNDARLSLLQYPRPCPHAFRESLCRTHHFRQSSTFCTLLPAGWARSWPTRRLPPSDKLKPPSGAWVRGEARSPIHCCWRVLPWPNQPLHAIQAYVDLGKKEEEGDDSWANCKFHAMIATGSTCHIRSKGQNGTCGEPLKNVFGPGS